MQDRPGGSKFADETLPREEGACSLIVVVALSFEDSKIKYDRPSSAPHFEAGLQTAGENLMLKTRLMLVIEQLDNERW